MSAPPSLRQRLFWRLLLLTLGVGAVMATVITLFTAQVINEEADRSLELAAGALYYLTEEEFDPRAGGGEGMPPLSAEDIHAFSAIADARVYAVFAEGVLAYQSAPITPLSTLPLRSGASRFSHQGKAWQAYAHRAGDNSVAVVVAEPLSVRSAVVVAAALRTLPPLLLLGLAAAILLYLALRSGLGELDRLARALTGRSAQDLEPLDTAAWSEELRGPVVALNRLHQRVRRAFRYEQRLNSMAAHQLRTPLAAIKLQAGLLKRASPSQFDPEMAKLEQLIDGAAGRIDQMLRLARLEARSLTRGPVRLGEVAATVLADQALIAAQAGVDFALEVTGDDLLITDGALLGLALEPLVENAIQHASDGGLVEIEVSVGAEGAVLSVLDRGRGSLSPVTQGGADRRRRSGLGLLIARRAARVLGGEFRIAPRKDGPGACAVITLPILEAQGEG